MEKKHFFGFFIPVGVSSLILIALFSSCDGFFPTQTKPDVPQDHSQNISGVLHKSGLFEPLDFSNGCMTASCHGNDLRGGMAVSSGRRVVVPSCYQCHGAVWEDGGESEGEGNDD